MSKSLCSILEKAAKDRGITVYQLCQKLHMPYTTYQNWHYGKSSAKHLTQEAILKKLNKLNGVKNDIPEPASYKQEHEENNNLSKAIVASNLTNDQKVEILKMLL